MRKYRRLPKYRDDDVELRREVEAIAAMTPDEVRAGLRQLGMRPAEVMPPELKRLLAGAASARAVPARAIPTFAPTRLRLTTKRLSGGIAALVCLLLCVISPTKSAGAWEPAARRGNDGHRARINMRIIKGVITLAPPEQMTWVKADSDEVGIAGDDANTCDRANPCMTLTGAVSKARVGGEIIVFTDRNDPSQIKIYQNLD